MNALQNKHILLGVTGGIAAYKAPDLVRRLAERGATVQVVMTHGAQQFVTPLTFQAVSGRPVRTDLWDEEAEMAMGHIELARWADIVLVAPATAEFLASTAGGKSDNLLSTVCLATDAPILLAPAMNRLMWADPATQANATTLRERGIELLGPGEGDQACGETGAGRMLEPLDIVDHVNKHLILNAQRGPLFGRRVMITAGPTRERLDPVRFLTNRSSGKMGFAVAEAARQMGAEVTLVAGPVSLPTPDGVTRVDVESAQQMHDAVHTGIGDVDIFVSAAAVSDYRAANVADQKIKKSADTMSIELTRNPDILKSVAALETPPYTVGFAAETWDVVKHARMKLEAKKLNLICANAVGECAEGKTLGFDVDDNELIVLSATDETPIARASKRVVARELMTLVAERYAAHSEEGSSCAASH
ncbi:MAG: bifunctional phosphopantothenoylcysteine decarboxylase/phosphopantothenate--cysteine ligase CoaBC [Pseudomonadota bacterium]